jgi:hypothetical protein
MTPWKSVVSVIACCGAFACDDSPSSPQLPSDAVYVRFARESLFVGETIGAIAIATSDDSSAVAWPVFEWTSSDTSVLVVDSTGAMLGRLTGTAFVVARFGDFSDSVLVRVVLRDVSDGNAFSAMSHGEHQMCALATGGIAYCDFVGSESRASEFAMLPGADTISLVSLGAALSHQCGLTSASEMYCWGRSGNGQFLNGDFGSVGVGSGPVRGGGLRRFSAVAVAARQPNSIPPRYTCGIELSTGLVRCAGTNSRGELGRPGPATDTAVAPVANNLVARSISASASRTCALTQAGEIWCWGGAFLQAEFGPRQLPAPVPFTAIDAADNSVCGVTSDGRLWCMPMSPGSAAISGFSPVHESLRFSQVISGTTWERLGPNSVSFHPFRCGLTIDGDLQCWGFYPPFVLSSRGDTTLAPIRVAPGTKFLTIAASQHHLCGITTAHTLVCM